MTGRAELERRIEDLVEPIVDAMGFALVALALSGPESRRRVVVTIDAPDGVTADDCERVSRRVEAALDASGLVGDDYVLEVESPGLTRVLRSEREFRHFAGRTVEVSTFAPVEGRRRFLATLVGPEQDALVLDVDGRETRIPWPQVARVRLHVEW